MIHNCIKRIRPTHGKCEYLSQVPCPVPPQPTDCIYVSLLVVSFQFSRIGNDAGAEKLLQDLDDHEELEEYIDTMPGTPIYPP